MAAWAAMSAGIVETCMMNSFTGWRGKGRLSGEALQEFGQRQQILTHFHGYREKLGLRVQLRICEVAE